MKKVCLIFLIALIVPVLHVKAIELEPRAGVSYAPNVLGLHIGAFASFQLMEKFFIQPGILLNTVGSGTLDDSLDQWKIGLNIPVYASFRLPVNETTHIRLNVGPYVGAAASLLSLGATGEVGVEIKKIYIGAAYFQNCINGAGAQLNLSVAYKFVL